MSDDGSSDDGFGGFAPPAFKPDGALLQLKRALRDLKLAERGNAFELRGKKVLELAVVANAIDVRIARKLSVAPEWDKASITSAAAQRKVLDDVKKRLARWDNED